MFGNQAVFSGRASVCANVHDLSRQKITKPDVNVALRSDSWTYLLTCEIVTQILAVRILSFYNRKLKSKFSEWIGLNFCRYLRVRYRS